MIRLEVELSTSRGHVRALGLAIILTVTGQIPALSFAADRCSGLFGISKLSIPKSALNLQTIADEWVDLDFQMRATDSSALHVALKAKRDQILAEIEEHQGPQAALELRSLIRGRRPKVEVFTKEQAERAAQVEQLKGRPKNLSKLSEVRSVGPFLNDHQFLTRTTDLVGGRLALYDLRTSSLDQVWTSKLLADARPIGISPNLDYFYLVNFEYFLIFNVTTGKIEKFRFSNWGRGTFQSAEQSKDRSTIFVTLADNGVKFMIKFRMNTDGSFKKSEQFDVQVGQAIVSSPDGNLMVTTASDSNIKIYDVTKDTSFRLPKWNDRNLFLKVVFSPDSTKFTSWKTTSTRLVHVPFLLGMLPRIPGSPPLSLAVMSRS